MQVSNPIQGKEDAPSKLARRQQTVVQKLRLTPGLNLFTCGCGDLDAEMLCSLLKGHGIHSVVDVRALPKSKKKPWFDTDRLAKSMKGVGLNYVFQGKGRKSHTVVASQVQRFEQPVCLLGFRASPLECARLVLAEKLVKGLGWTVTHFMPDYDDLPNVRLLCQAHVDLFARYSNSLLEINIVQTRLDRRFGFLGHWRDRILQGYSSIHYEQWDRNVSRIHPTVIQLPWGTVLMVVPGFLAKAKLSELQERLLPGAINFEQPRRRVRFADGNSISVTNRHKEAWLCDDYDFPDPNRVAPPCVYKRRHLRPWAEDLLDHVSHTALAPFNGMMCRWDPPGVGTNDGPRTFARGGPMPEYAVVSMLAVSGSRGLRVHGLGCWEKLAVDVPLSEGNLVVLGGPLKERWLHVHLHESHVQHGERVCITFHLHADRVQLASANNQPKHQTCKGQSEAGPRLSRWRKAERTR
eukprot:TRINITY_DN57169_c0_g1_i1.p1 TRINITY_DN57169_c0_g1~~TRINITY_DN57169_c0_g1_i1.p1  ORF type:complete len:539 (+),score=49.99 TRINITY_DN57169_c0_g1_i1:224-1618(+)